MSSAASFLANAQEIDFDNVCRACLGAKPGLQPIFGASLNDMLTAVTRIEVQEGDEFPQKLCVQCVLQISRSYTFKQNFIKSDAILRDQLLRRKALKEAEATQTTSQVNSHPILNNFTNIPIISVVSNQGQHSKESSVIGANSFDAIILENSQKMMVPNDHCYDRFEVSQVPAEIQQSAMPARDRRDEIFDSNFNNLDCLSELTECDLGNDHAHIVCQKCQCTFESSLQLQIHTSTVHSSACHVCGKKYTDTALKRHLKTHLEVKPYVCDLCNHSFADKSNLKKHFRKHTGEMKKVKGKYNLCSVCGKQFKWASSLAKHFKYHTGHKLYKCQYCSKEYAEAQSFNIHIRSHTGERPYVCMECGNGFTQKCSLEKHMRVHTGEKPFSCSVCSRSFSQQSYVAVHMRIHTGEKPYICKVCNKGFTSWSILNSHKRIHKKTLPCANCQKMFATQEALENHKCSQNQNKQHICLSCGKGFQTIDRLTTHMRTHSSEETVQLQAIQDLADGVEFECGMCGQSFLGNNDLVGHLRSHIEENEQHGGAESAAVL